MYVHAGRFEHRPCARYVSVEENLGVEAESGRSWYLDGKHSGSRWERLWEMEVLPENRGEREDGSICTSYQTQVQYPRRIPQGKRGLGYPGRYRRVSVRA